MKSTHTERRPASRQRGFGLLEFMISIGFMSALAGLISGSTLLSIRTSNESGAVADIAVETAKTTRWLVRDIHEAETTNLVDLAAPVNTATFNWNDGGPVSCTLSVVNNFFRRVCGASTISIGRNVSNLTFVRNGDLITASYLITPPDSPGKAKQVTLNVAMGGG